MRISGEKGTPTALSLPASPNGPGYDCSTMLSIQRFFCYDRGMFAPHSAEIIDPIVLAGLAALAGLLLGAVIGALIYRSMGAFRQWQTLHAARREAERAGQAERERLRSIYNLISALTATLNYQRVLDNALDLSANALGAHTESSDRLVSAVLLF